MLRAELGHCNAVSFCRFAGVPTFVGLLQEGRAKYWTTEHFEAKKLSTTYSDGTSLAPREKLVRLYFGISSSALHITGSHDL